VRHARGRLVSESLLALRDLAREFGGVDAMLEAVGRAYSHPYWGPRESVTPGRVDAGGGVVRHSRASDVLGPQLALDELWRKGETR